MVIPWRHWQERTSGSSGCAAERRHIPAPCRRRRGNSHPPQHNAASAVGTAPDEVRGPPGRVVIEGCASPPAASVTSRVWCRAGGRENGWNMDDRCGLLPARRCCCLYLQHKGPFTAVQHLVATAMPTNMPRGRISDPRCLGFANERPRSTARCSELSTHRECLARQGAGDDYRRTEAPNAYSDDDVSPTRDRILTSTGTRTCRRRAQARPARYGSQAGQTSHGSHKHFRQAISPCPRAQIAKRTGLDPSR
jgi:hypothetical protein